jgi:hypothetical protein
MLRRIAARLFSRNLGVDPNTLIANSNWSFACCIEGRTIASQYAAALDPLQARLAGLSHPKKEIL